MREQHGWTRRSVLAAGVAAVAGRAWAAPSVEVDFFGRLVANAKYVYGHIADYGCTFVKQERIDGTLQPEQIALMKVRLTPFSVHLKFTGPADVAGREAMYVVGKNNGQMKVKPGGLIGGAVGFVSLDLRDPRAMKSNRHTLDEAGVGHLIDRMAASHAREKNLPGLRNQIAEVNFNNRPCVRVDSVHTQARQNIYAYRCVTCFDKETHLPVRFEAYDAPAAGGDPAGVLVECYSYLNTRFNLGLTDRDFGV